MAEVMPQASTVTLVAATNPGYIFVNWTEGATTVSTSPSYTFAATANRTLVANFIALPSLAMATPAPGALTISWPEGAPGWLLEESPDLAPGTWVESTRPVTIEGTQKQVIITDPAGACFFRLKHP